MLCFRTFIPLLSLCVLYQAIDIDQFLIFLRALCVIYHIGVWASELQIVKGYWLCTSQGHVSMSPLHKSSYASLATLLFLLYFESVVSSNVAFPLRIAQGIAPFHIDWKVGSTDSQVEKPATIKLKLACFLNLMITCFLPDHILCTSSSLYPRDLEMHLPYKLLLLWIIHNPQYIFMQNEEALCPGAT